MGKGNAQGKGRRGRGAVRLGEIVRRQIRPAAEKRGFAETRLLTHWREVVGAEIAAMCRPVKISYARDGFGATLTLLTNGAFAPIVDARREEIRERINAVHGYNAISRIRVTQSAAEMLFAPEAPPPAKLAPPRHRLRSLDRELSSIENEDLRKSLRKLGEALLAEKAAGATGGQPRKDRPRQPGRRNGQP